MHEPTVPKKKIRNRVLKWEHSKDEVKYVQHKSPYLTLKTKSNCVLLFSLLKCLTSNKKYYLLTYAIRDMCELRSTWTFNLRIYYSYKTERNALGAFKL
jgi:hypothetical protein